MPGIGLASDSQTVDSIPAAIDIAIPRGRTRPALKAPCRLHQFDPQTFDLGREALDVGARAPLGIYSTERSLVDIIRTRHLQGSDLAWEALRRWLRQPASSPVQLIEIAKHFAATEPAIRRALEIHVVSADSRHDSTPRLAASSRARA